MGVKWIWNTAQVLVLRKKIKKPKQMIDADEFLELEYNIPSYTFDDQQTFVRSSNEESKTLGQMMTFVHLTRTEGRVHSPRI